MPTFSLKSLKISAEYQLTDQDYLPSLDLDWRGFRETSLGALHAFLNLATAKLLLEFQPTHFFINLHHCAENWRNFIVASEQNFQRKIPLFHDAPLYAALITRDQRILTEIAKALDPSFKKGQEYEDIFYICWLHLSLALNQCAFDDKTSNLLNALENCQVNSHDSQMFKALLGQDELTEKDFWDTFESALYEHELYVEKRIASFSVDVTQFAVHRFLWLKGISYLQLAQIKGFTLPSTNILFCPDEALAPPPTHYPAAPQLIQLIRS